MHLGNGAITPECAAVTYSAAAAGLVAGAAAMRRSGIRRDQLLLALGLGGAVFAAQAVNVPVAAGTSAHLVGGVLLAAVLGPGLGAWTMAIVLALQAALLGDGGFLALGANVLNMALLPAVAVACLRSAASRSLAADSARTWAALGTAAALALPLAAGLIVVETALFRPSAELAGWGRFAALMIGTHAWIGLLEGTMTAALLAAIAALRSPALQWPLWRTSLGALAGLAIIAALALPLSSSLPDGYEAAAQASGLEFLLTP